MEGNNSYFFFFNDTATTEIYTLSLHDALPISQPVLESAERFAALRATARGEAERRRAMATATRLAIEIWVYSRPGPCIHSGMSRVPCSTRQTSTRSVASTWNTMCGKRRTGQERSPGRFNSTE